MHPRLRLRYVSTRSDIPENVAESGGLDGTQGNTVTQRQLTERRGRRKRQCSAVQGCSPRKKRRGRTTAGQVHTWEMEDGKRLRRVGHGGEAHSWGRYAHTQYMHELTHTRRCKYAHGKQTHITHKMYTHEKRITPNTHTNTHKLAHKGKDIHRHKDETMERKRPITTTYARHNSNNNNSDKTFNTKTTAKSPVHKRNTRGNGDTTTP